MEEIRICHGGYRGFCDYLCPDTIYLLDYKTGKKDPKHKEQLNDYVSAIRSMTDKEIRGYLVYLSEEGIEVV